MFAVHYVMTSHDPNVFVLQQMRSDQVRSGQAMPTPTSTDQSGLTIMGRNLAKKNLVVFPQLKAVTDGHRCKNLKMSGYAK